jgi:hypothetical protein
MGLSLFCGQILEPIATSRSFFGTGCSEKTLRGFERPVKVDILTEKPLRFPSKSPRKDDHESLAAGSCLSRTRDDASHDLGRGGYRGCHHDVRSNFIPMGCREVPPRLTVLEAFGSGQADRNGTDRVDEIQGSRLIGSELQTKVDSYGFRPARLPLDGVGPFSQGGLRHRTGHRDRSGWARAVDRRADARRR